MSNDDDQMLGVSIGRTSEVNNPEKDLPLTNTGDNLVPVFSRILQSEHSTILKNYLNTEKNILPTDLGYIPVKVITTNVRWPNSTSNESKDDETYHLSTDNKMVKNERQFQKKPNVFDHAECDTENLRHIHSKSSLVSAGFAYTEIVPIISTILADDDSIPMSIASKYGRPLPRQQIFPPTENEYV